MPVVVTGASSGIGLELAKVFGREGCRVSLVARRRAALLALCEEIPVETQAIDADLSDTRDPIGWLRRAEEAFGPTDVLVNNAGISYVEPVQGLDPQRIGRLFQINVHTPIAAIHHVLPGMMVRRRGTIVNVASNAAFSPAPYFAITPPPRGRSGSCSRLRHHRHPPRPATAPRSSDTGRAGVVGRGHAGKVFAASVRARLGWSMRHHPPPETPLTSRASAIVAVIVWTCRFFIVLGFAWTLRLALVTAEMPSSHDPSFHPDRWPFLAPILAVATVGSVGALGLTRFLGQGEDRAIIAVCVMFVALGGHFFLTLVLALMTMG